MSAAYEDRVLYQGDVWVRIDTLPRILAEGWRRNLMDGGVVSVVRTPFQWSMGSPVIEIETGGYQGDVGLYVPEVQLAEALELLGFEPGDDTDADTDVGASGTGSGGADRSGT
ncbi:hypothetical protein GCM10008959_37610 [Deinococcus seoulensis]|uniref:Uncharacterized protein n=1 Tax=Deinococcus seoulensis TaxID=1837379 RepID=A0ABQ2RW05_9DEIO|nr:hypothetical protein [Deinococcus seoulensis]GGR72588.1 hypothetical protein GCM10008959_37610 [Deinococcus seoulensis]